MSEVAVFPRAGALRLHRQPTQLKPLSSRQEHPGDRFDDPDREFRVRYLATTLQGCLLEVLDHFRRNERIEAALAAVTGVDELDIWQLESAGAVPEKWLTEQRIARARLTGGTLIINVMDDAVLSGLDRRQRVRRALAKLSRAAVLDHGTIRLGTELGRPISQAVARELYEDDRKPAGIRYTSRVSDSEECWALFDDRADCEFDTPIGLSRTNARHKSAVNNAAALLGLVLPPSWRRRRSPRRAGSAHT